jgi:hypothetical protein
MSQGAPLLARTVNVYIQNDFQILARRNPLQPVWAVNRSSLLGNFYTIGRGSRASAQGEAARERGAAI